MSDNITLTETIRTTSARTAGTPAHNVEATEVRRNGELVETVVWTRALTARLDRAGTSRGDYLTRVAARYEATR